MPLYVADYLADTGHLTTEEHGAYLLLLMHHWRGGPLPDDDRKLAHMVRLTVWKWRRLRPTLAEMFQVEGGTWAHKRVIFERTRAISNAVLRNSVARSAAASRWKRTKHDPAEHDSSMSQACSEHTPSPSPSPLPPALHPVVPPTAPQAIPPVVPFTASQESAAAEKPVEDRNVRRGSRLAPDWQPSDADREFARDLGLDPGAIAAEFADYWHGIPGQRGTKLNWSGAWRNWCRRNAGQRPGNARQRSRGVVEVFADVARELADRETP